MCGGRVIWLLKQKVWNTICFFNQQPWMNKKAFLSVTEALLFLSPNSPFFDNHVRPRSSRLKTQDNHFLVDQGVVISEFGDEFNTVSLNFAQWEIFGFRGHWRTSGYSLILFSCLSLDTYSVNLMWQFQQQCDEERSTPIYQLREMTATPLTSSQVHGDLP